MTATIDLETYSEAGYVFDQKWQLAPDTPKGTRSGLAAVGVFNYAQHPTTEVLSLSYALGDEEPALWLPGMPPPQPLFDHIAAGGLVEAHNSLFEWAIWEFVCHARMGWSRLWYTQLRDSMAKAQAFSFPGALAKATEAAGLGSLKDPAGTRLLNKFSRPRNPTKKNPALRLLPSDEPVEGARLYEYNRQDVRAERSLSRVLPELQPRELDLWLLDQRINIRGVEVDRESLDACVDIIRQARRKYEAELYTITGGALDSAGKLEKMRGWLGAHGVHVTGLTEEDVTATLERDNLPDVARRVLEIRQQIGSASVKKTFAMQRQIAADNRLHGLFNYCGASSTGRWAGKGPQPQNLPGGFAPERVEEMLAIIRTRSLEAVEEAHEGGAFRAVSGCLRGLFIGRDLICSDYSAIEAVVLAALAGEEWRLEVFRTHGRIYEESAARIMGTTIDEFLQYKAEHGSHHPMRKKLGKPAELGGGFGGGLGAWKRFGAGDFMSDDEIRHNVRLWRKASPRIVDFWYSLERAAHNAVRYPGKWFECNGLAYVVTGDVLYCRLLSGRFLHYVHPRIVDGKYGPVLSFWGTHQKYGWCQQEAWYGLTVENVVQATARDVLAHALPNLERAGYGIVLHVHDEPVGEAPRGHGSVEHFEQIMTDLPAWCRDWPIKAAGGWRGLRYRKD